MLDVLRRELLAVLVPPLCAACREPELSGAAVCPGCRAQLVALRDPRCRRCGAPRPFESDDCRECRGRRLAFSRAWSPFAYEGAAARVVRSLKSHGAIEVAAFMAGEIARRAPTTLIGGALVPVPAHPRRRRTQGFNQAARVASALSRRTGLPVVHALERVGPAGPQRGLDRRERLSNPLRSLRLRPRPAVPARALLVDDVYTTGATLDACAHALLEGGSREVAAVTFARTVRL